MIDKQDDGMAELMDLLSTPRIPRQLYDPKTGTLVPNPAHPANQKPQ